MPPASPQQNPEDQNPRSIDDDALEFVTGGVLQPHNIASDPKSGPTSVNQTINITVYITHNI